MPRREIQSSSWDEKFIYRDFGREPYEGDDAIAREVIQKYYMEEEENEKQ